MDLRIQQLIRLALSKQQETQRTETECLFAQKQWTVTKAKLDQLSDFKRDYLRQFDMDTHQSANMEDRLRLRMDFINQIEVPLSRLKSDLSLLTLAKSKAERDYKQARSAEEALIKLIGRAKKTQNNVQKETKYSTIITDESNAFSETIF